MSTQIPPEASALLNYIAVIEELMSIQAWDAIEELIRALPKEPRTNALLKLRALQTLAAHILPRFEGEL